ncbi:hypothetical protein, partial [Thermomonas sp.]|uniref:hypothetical protein n=1 Tax=Thermomonas sp. TaxID=1971895 RepID=UPI002619625F
SPPTTRSGWDGVLALAGPLAAETGDAKKAKAANITLASKPERLDIGWFSPGNTTDAQQKFRDDAHIPLCAAQTLARGSDEGLPQRNTAPNGIDDININTL